MANKYDALAKAIVDNVGGKANINGLTHCVTRLRFTLKDEKQANTAAMEKLDGVMKVVNAGGQYQVVVGNKVDTLYELILASGIEGGGEVDAAADEAPEKTGVINTLMNTISGILTPTLGVLTAAGIVKGVISLAATLGWCSTTSGLYMVLYALGDGFF
ncbi:MAG: PTS transporter subunit EIIB, partial [Gemmiger sp.]